MANLMSQVVHLTELGNGVVQITMRDEEYRNTFSQGLIDGLYECFAAVANNETYKVVILTGYSSYFCSGGTKEELIRIHNREIKFDDLDFFRIALDCPLPVISAMQGHGIGGGFVMGLYADLVVLSQESIYTTNFMKYGFTPGMGCTLIVPEKLGAVVGSEMMYTARNYRGKELAERGIPFPVLPRKEVLSYARQIAQEIAEKPRLSLMTLKRHLSGEARDKLPSITAQEVAMHEITFHQPEVARLINIRFGEGNQQSPAASVGKIDKPQSAEEQLLSQLQLGEISVESAEQLLFGHHQASEDILLQLQSGDISLDAAEQFLLGNEQKAVNVSEDILLQLQSGELSLEAAEQLLLEEPLPSEDILSQLQLGQVSLDRAEELLLGIEKNDSNSRDDVLSQLQSEEVSLEEAEQLLTEVKTTDIAIIGISCRYPGANNWQEFWQNLQNGVDSITEVPPEKWPNQPNQQWYDPNPDNPQTSYSKWSGFIEDVDKFDPFFFKIAPGEAEYMEPQHRIFLEETYHAIEDAGYAPESLKGKPCGVFVGAANGDYTEVLLRSGYHTNRQVLTGNSVSVLPARIAYFLDLRGPVMAIETACSSSLVSIHQACESIQRGECEMALAGGITLMLTPTQNIVTSQYKMLSPEGRCRTFDASASGIVWSEGCGIVMLKSYEDAVKDGDRIYGLIKGSGINYDGKTNGITAPSGQSQLDLEKKVYDKLGINPATIGFVEAHGTGTPLGDPIEMEALGEVFSQYTEKRQYCPIGSVKTNIGHTAWAAGVASVIKAVLCLKYRQLVPSLHFSQPNPHIDFANSPFYVNTELKAWESLENQPRRVAVSSLGFSGTNAHAVLEEAPTSPIRNTLSKDNIPLYLLTLSAKSEGSLEQLVRAYRDYLETPREDNIASICYTANTGRSHFNHRLTVIANNQQEFAEKLRRYNEGETVDGLFSRLPLKSSKPKIAFLFTGQGSQYVNMGRQLYENSVVFRDTINECDRLLRSALDRSLLSLIYPEIANQVSQLDQTGYTQPALFAIEYALAKMWQSWGIQPHIVMGHSVGEYVAATISGIFSLEDGLKLIATRGRLMQQLPSGGTMVAVMASESIIRPLLTQNKKVEIAAINGPESIVISGEKEAINGIINNLESQGIKTKLLQVSHAFHSFLMEPMLAEFETVAHQITYYQPQIPIISNVTGVRVEQSISTAQYWINHIRKPVKFAQGMEVLDRESCDIFLEIGPHPILLGMGRKCLPETSASWLPSLRRGGDEWQHILASLAQLYVQGVNIDWLAFEQKTGQNGDRQKVSLPTYPFERQRYWVETSNNDPIFNSLNSGDIHTLVNQISQTEKLSKSELKLLPKLLKTLQHYQQQTQLQTEKTPPKSKTKKHSSLIKKLQQNSAEECQQTLVRYLEKQARQLLKVNSNHSLNLHQSILDLGFDSLSAIELKTQIETELNITLSAGQIISGPSIIELATQLTESIKNNYNFAPNLTVKENHNPWIAYHKIEPDATIRLFCFHPWGSSASMFQHWFKQLPSEIEVIPIQLPGRQQRIAEQPFTNFSNLIETLGELLHSYSDKPLALFGHSMGAIIAFEVASYLQNQYSIQPTQLFLSGAKPPSDLSWLNHISSLSQEEKLKYLLQISEIPQSIYQNQSLLDEFMKVFNADLQLVESYAYSGNNFLNCPIYSFSGIDDPIVSKQELAQWSSYTQGIFDMEQVPGKHMFFQDSQSLLLQIIGDQLLKNTIRESMTE